MENDIEKLQKQIDDLIKETSEKLDEGDKLLDEILKQTIPTTVINEEINDTEEKINE